MAACSGMAYLLTFGQASVMALTSIKYKVERNKRYLPYIELGCWLCSHFQLEAPLNFHTPITQTIQHRAINLTSFDFLGSCELVYVYIKLIKLAEI